MENRQLHRGQGHSIVLNTVPAGGLERRLDADSAWFRALLFSTYEPLSPLPVVQFRALRIGDNLDVKGDIELHASFSCNRCGTAGEIHERLPFAALFVPAGASEVSLTDIDDGGAEDAPVAAVWGMSTELFLGDIKDGCVDLDAAIVDTLVLGLNPYPLCDEDCKGLCAGCGANLNHEPCSCAPPPVDNRWAKLAALRLEPAPKPEDDGEKASK